ncbi:MAG: hypothetical protein RBJ76_13085 [Stenomitos frigidus ULC029]
MVLFKASPVWAASTVEIHHKVPGKGRVVAGAVNCSAITYKGGMFSDVLIAARISGLFGGTDRGFRLNPLTPPTFRADHRDIHVAQSRVLPTSSLDTAELTALLRVTGTPPHKIRILGATPIYTPAQSPLGFVRWSDQSGLEIMLDCGGSGDRLQKGFVSAANAVGTFARRTGEFLLALPNHVVNGTSALAGIGLSFLFQQLVPGAQP